MSIPRRRTCLGVLVATLSSLALLFSGCTTSTDDAGRPRDCVTDYDAARDYFPDKATVEYAKNFTIAYHPNYAVLTVNQPFPGGPPQRYVLVRCGTPAPDTAGDLAGAQTVEIPVRTVYSGSTTQLPWFTELGVLDALTGAADTSMITSEQVRARVDEGKVTQYATGATVDTERVLAGRPDVLLTDGTENPAYAVLRRAGVPVVAIADWLEAGPLATAEWIKVLGVLTGTTAKAQEVFGGIAQRYRALAEKARGVPATRILYGADFQGTWTVPGADSSAGTMIRDAGGDWPWSDRSGTSVHLSFEEVVTRAGDVPIWLVSDNQWTTVADVEKVDPRYRNLAAVATGQVWNANLAMGPTGGNDFFESGSARPDLVLADTVAILHPELLPDHTFVYYRRLGR